ncbi:MAG: DUF1549 and DUF1553 domain-containing protein [Limisphaerales bacterium]
MIRFIQFSSLLLGLVTGANSADLTLEARGSGADLTLIGPYDSQQLLITSADQDITRQARYSVKPKGIAEVDANGLVKPKANGKGTLSVAWSDGSKATLKLTVERFEKEPPMSFANDIVPIFTRNHCNAGGCHAKAMGQNGFRLSLFGYEPAADYEGLLGQARGRRISPAAPKASLFLRKASGAVPHQGGVRLDREGADYQTIVRWISQGMPYEPKDAPVVDRISVQPRHRVLQPESEQQLVVTAFFSDGTRRDITRAAQFEPSHEDMSAVDQNGLVKIASRTGSTSVMIRFREHVDLFRSTIPLGHEIPKTAAPANFIDEHVFAQQRLLGIPASAPSEDHVFLRRVTIGIAGRIPTLAETDAFLASKAPDKRAQLIDQLLELPEYADHFAGKWAGILRNKGGLDWQSRETYAFHDWIRQSIAENRPFDRLVTELVTASGRADVNPAVAWYRTVKDPKEQMADIAQVFLGIRMKCAQCHHHPYEKWSQDDYYGFAAFFSTLARKEIYKLPENDMVYHKMQLAAYENPATKVKLKPTPLDGKALDLPATQDPRVELARWMTAKENPYFARMLVNRYWKHFFGRGLVEPEDDIRITNPATHPELLQALTESFKKSGYDLKKLVRTICNSRSYQLSSNPTPKNSADSQFYARYYPRRLSAEVMLDSINDLTGSENSFNRLPIGVRAIALPDDQANKESVFLTVFGRPQNNTACECERSDEATLTQSLHLINSSAMQSKLTGSKGRAAQLAADKERPDAERINELYRRAVCRDATTAELAVATAHLKKKRGQSAKDPKKLPLATAERQAFEDIIWVVANTKEFLYNR